MGPREVEEGLRDFLSHIHQYGESKRGAKPLLRATPHDANGCEDHIFGPSIGGKRREPHKPRHVVEAIHGIVESGLVGVEGRWW